MDFQVLRSKDMKDSCIYYLIQPDVHHLLPKIPWNPSFCCFWAIILWVRKVQLTPVSATGGFGSFPNFLWAPWNNFWEIVFPFCQSLGHGYKSPQHSSVCIVCVCLCIKTLLALQGWLGNYLGLTPTPAPSGQTGISVQTLCDLREFWLTQLPADFISSKLAPFGHLRLSESHQLCFCWASRRTTDFCIIL